MARLFLLIFIVGGFSVSGVLAERLILKDQEILWEGYYFVFPEDVVTKEENLQNQKTLRIYPARREPFYVVIRKLSIQSLSFAREEWEREIFWKGKNQSRKEIEILGIKSTVFMVDQIRNQNLLRAHLWLRKEGKSAYWFWVMYRKERADLETFFEKGQFLKKRADK